MHCISKAEEANNKIAEKGYTCIEKNNFLFPSPSYLAIKPKTIWTVSLLDQTLHLFFEKNYEVRDCIPTVRMSNTGRGFSMICRKSATSTDI